MFDIPGLIEGAKKGLARGGLLDSAGSMIRGGFLSPAQRLELLGLLRDGCAEQRVARRANAMLLLDDGWSCEKVAKALYLDDDTVRGWRKTYVADGVEGLRRFEGGGSASYLSAEQEARLTAWIGETLPPARPARKGATPGRKAPTTRSDDACGTPRSCGNPGGRDRRCS